MGRYSNIPIQKDSNKKRVRRTINLPEITPSSNDTYIIGQVGDRLDTLADKYYGRSSYWWIIALANNIGKGDLVVPVGVQIRIPSNVDFIVKQFDDLNK